MSLTTEPQDPELPEPLVSGDPEQLLTEGAHALGVPLSDTQRALLLAYLDRVLEANQTLNLTAVRSRAEATVKHLVDSLTVLSILPDRPSLSLIDVGSGAGFPGVPLLILRPGWQVTLLDARQKRLVAVQHILDELGLARGVTFVRERAEITGQRWDFRQRYDAALARAVAPLNVLAEYCLPFVKVGGVVVAMKGPKAEEERQEAKPAIKALGGRLNRIENLALPFDAGARSLVVIDKIRMTPNRYPRRPGEPERSPITGHGRR